MFNKTLKYSVAALTMAMPVSMAHAETVTTKTFVQAKDNPAVNEIDFTVFDINNDGIFSMEEVGKRLFISFDRDNNDLIDNIEWNKKTVLTIAPMEQETFQFIDYDDDGYTDKSTYTYQTFYQASGLVRFDDNADGLSASEFIDTPMQKLDKDGDNLINLKEWEEAYKESRPKHEQSESYN